VALSKTTEAYIEFFKINRESYGEKIRFFESNRTQIDFLPEAENLELRLFYLIALFEVSEYQKYLFLVDQAIEQVVLENVYDFNGGDIYYQLLINKASSLYHLFRTTEAKTLSYQLRGINPNDKRNNFLFQKIHQRNLSDKTRHIKAIGIALYFFSGFIIAIQLFLIDPFYNQYNLSAQWLWQGFFALASVVLVFNELRIKYLAKRKLDLAR